MTLEPNDLKDWAAGLQRELLKEIDEAIARLGMGKGRLSEESVHEVRKSMKKVRAGAKLLGGLPGLRKKSAEANTVFRDAGRPLSEVRDAEVMVEAVGELMRHFGERADAGLGRRLTAALSRRRAKVRTEVLDEKRARGSVLRAVKAGRTLVNSAKAGTPAAEKLIAVITRTYRKGRIAFREAEADGGVETLHEARKRTKDLRYALELCEDVYAALAPMADVAREMTDCLGTDHDLAVLRDLLDGDEAIVLDEPDRLRMDALLEERRKELVDQAKKLGVGLYAEKPKSFRKRLEAIHKGLAELRERA